MHYKLKAKPTQQRCKRCDQPFESAHRLKAYCSKRCQKLAQWLRWYQNKKAKGFTNAEIRSGR